MKLSQVVIVLLSILGWIAYLNELSNAHKRTDDVRIWAGAAYDAGRSDCSINQQKVIEYNRQFAVGSVIDAHNGAFRYTRLPSLP